MGGLAEANASVDSIIAFWTSDARVILPVNHRCGHGGAARHGSRQKASGIRITWTPDSAVVSPSGDVGYTYGPSYYSPDEKVFFTRLRDAT